MKEWEKTLQFLKMDPSEKKSLRNTFCQILGNYSQYNNADLNTKINLSNSNKDLNYISSISEELLNRFFLEYFKCKENEIIEKIERLEAGNQNKRRTSSSTNYSKGSKIKEYNICYKNIKFYLQSRQTNPTDLEFERDSKFQSKRLTIESFYSNLRRELKSDLTKSRSTLKESIHKMEKSKSSFKNTMSSNNLHSSIIFQKKLDEMLNLNLKTTIVNNTKSRYPPKSESQCAVSTSKTKSNSKQKNITQTPHTKSKSPNKRVNVIDELNARLNHKFSHNLYLNSKEKKLRQGKSPKMSLLEVNNTKSKRLLSNRFEVNTIYNINIEVNNTKENRKENTNMKELTLTKEISITEENKQKRENNYTKEINNIKENNITRELNNTKDHNQTRENNHAMQAQTEYNAIKIRTNLFYPQQTHANAANQKSINSTTSKQTKLIKPHEITNGLLTKHNHKSKSIGSKI